MISRPLTRRDEFGREMVVPCIIPDEVNPYTTGEGDAPGQIGGGEEFYQYSDSISDFVAITDFSFSSDVWVASGLMESANAPSGSHISMDLYAKPTQLAPQQNGNFSLSLTGQIMFTPGIGTHDLVASGGPSLNLLSQGFWDIDPVSGSFVPNFSGSGQYDLFEAEKQVVRWINKIRFFGSKTRSIDPHSKARMVPSSYFFRVTTFFPGAVGLREVWWDLLIGRPGA